MPKAQAAEYPQVLRPYFFHRVELSYKEDAKEATGALPVLRRSKFYISAETGQYDCKVGGERGNAFTFIRQLHKYSVASDGDLDLVAEERGISVDILKKWGLTKSLTSGEWILPAYGPKGEINNLYVWRKIGDKLRLLPTAEFVHCLFGTQFWDEHRANVIVAEGPWDAMALEMVLSEVKRESERIVVAQTPEESMVSNYNIVAVPGCETFRDEWQERFSGKNVYFIYDNDHPRTNKAGTVLQPAAYLGMQRAVNKLSAYSPPPFGLNIVRWGLDGYSPNIPSGYDLRDYFTTSHDGDSVAQITELLAMLGPAPDEWLAGTSSSGSSGLPSAPRLETLPCTSYEDLIAAWKATFSWSDPLDITLSVLLATNASTKGLGDQVWVRVLGNPGSGKTTFCAAMKVYERGVFSVSQFTGVHSGYTGPGSNGDAGLIPHINGKSFIINEGDTLLQNPNRAKLMSDLRDLHAGFASNLFMNGVRMTYEGIRTTVILAGTSRLRELNASSLGDRFLDCNIYNQRSRAEERQLVRTDLRAKMKTFLHQANCEAQTQDTPERIRAQQLTGGFLEYLQTVVADRQKLLEDSEEFSDSCETLGDLIAHMRSKPHDDDAPVEKELHFRLASQVAKLGVYLAIVLNRQLDGEVLRRLAKVAHDTCHGINYDICNKLWDKPLDSQSLEMRLSHNRDKINKALGTLRELKLITADTSVTKVAGTKRNANVYKLTDHAKLLLSKVKKLLAYSEESNASPVLQEKREHRNQQRHHSNGGRNSGRQSTVRR
jgi:hypothetical protein